MTRTLELRESTLIVEQGIARMTHLRPAQRNPLTDRLREDYRDMLAQVSADADVRVLILTGSGGSFCSGGDIRAMLERHENPGEHGTPASTRQRILALHDWLGRLRNLEIPVIAAVDGPAMGAGFSLALAADFIVASRRAMFSMSFNRIGAVPDMGAAYLLPRLIGLARAKEIMMTARRVEAEEAHALGLVLSLHDHDSLDSAATALAECLASAPQPSMGLTKRLANQSFELDAAASAELEASAQAICMAGDAHREAIGRFVRREAPVFDFDRDQPSSKACGSSRT